MGRRVHGAIVGDISRVRSTSFIAICGGLWHCDTVVSGYTRVGQTAVQRVLCLMRQRQRVMLTYKTKIWHNYTDRSPHAKNRSLPSYTLYDTSNFMGFKATELW